MLTVCITEKVTCTYYNQELHGTPIKPTGRGRHGRLDGTYAYATVRGKRTLLKEGYTEQDWGKVSMGRWMMYKVFDLDEILFWSHKKWFETINKIENVERKNSMVVLICGVIMCILAFIDFAGADYAVREAFREGPERITWQRRKAVLEISLGIIGILCFL